MSVTDTLANDGEAVKNTHLMLYMIHFLLKLHETKYETPLFTILPNYCITRVIIVKTNAILHLKSLFTR